MTIFGKPSSLCQVDFHILRHWEIDQAASKCQMDFLNNTCSSKTQKKCRAPLKSVPINLGIKF